MCKTKYIFRFTFGERFPDVLDVHKTLLAEGMNWLKFLPRSFLFHVTYIVKPIEPYGVPGVEWSPCNSHENWYTSEYGNIVTRASPGKVRPGHAWLYNNYDGLTIMPIISPTYLE